MMLQTGSLVSALLLCTAHLSKHWAMHPLQLYLASFITSEENHTDKRQLIFLLQYEVSPRTTVLLFTIFKGNLDKQVDTGVYIKISGPTLSAWSHSCCGFLVF